LRLARHRSLRLAACAVGLVAIPISALVMTGTTTWSQTRTIKIVVPLAPGGGGDIVARLVAEQVARTQGPTMVVENRPGAGTAIATEAVARAAPDGNTLLITNPAFVINSHLRKLNYDPLTGFEPICNLASFPQLIVVNTGSPYRTLADLLNAARVKPGELTMASFGPASAVQMAFERLKRAANINMTYVPYQGTAPAITALLGEHVTAVFADYPTVAEQLRAAKLRALAIGSPMRIEPLPEVPTVAESGFKDYEAESWNGLVAPAKTPKEMLTQLVGWVTTALEAPEMKLKLAAQGLFPVKLCGADYGALLRKQYDDYGRIIREANIKVD
jgi:tripartite-type tricarboxylate transporter receptor subunit TctC